MPEILYRRWDYDTRQVIQFERLGECKNCGDCCKAMIEFRASRHSELAPNIAYDTDPDPRDGGDGVTQEGVWLEVQIDGLRRFWQMIQIDTTYNKACSALTEDMRCSVHFDKKAICYTWPIAPEQVTPFERCSYSFQEIARWEMTGSKEELPPHD